MRAPAFWADPASLRARLLAPLGQVYGAITLARMARAGGRVGVPVICVGNPTLGGAGKTPVAIALLHHIAAQGGWPFALLRGHGGTAQTPLLVDPAGHDAGEVGDEALLLARHAPTVVAGGDRLGGALLAARLGASHIVMDDGFQNATLHKDASLLVVDGGFGLGNGRVFPAGPLRAPLAPQLARADALMVVGGGDAGDRLVAGLGPARGETESARSATADAGRDMAPSSARARELPSATRHPPGLDRAAGSGSTHASSRPQAPGPTRDAARPPALLRGALVPDPAAVERLRGRPLHAFAGIGRPEKMFAMLEALGLDVRETTAFPDHHPYSAAEIDGLVRRAAAAGALPVTTEKDMARLGSPGFAAARQAIATIPVTLETAPDGLDRLVRLAEERHRQSKV